MPQNPNLVTQATNVTGKTKQDSHYMIDVRLLGFRRGALQSMQTGSANCKVARDSQQARSLFP